MPTISDISNAPVSGLNHIDSLLDYGPAWNFITPYTNTITYTFSVSSGTLDTRPGGLAFSATQQANTRTALAYISGLTGIQFVETTVGTNAQLHFEDIDIKDTVDTTGLTVWNATYQLEPDDTLSAFHPNAHIYLDNAEFKSQNQTLTPGGFGYETLLHELGHALGLKHPFDDSPNLPASEDNTSFTLMSYDSLGGPYSTFRAYDVDALMFLYGGDGLAGNYGVNGKGSYIVGSDHDETITGSSGNDYIDGGAGTDTLVYTGAHTAFIYLTDANGTFHVSGAQGNDAVVHVEKFSFNDGIFTLAQLQVDSTPPAAPTITADRDATNLVVGTQPTLSGTAEAGATVRISSANTVVATTTADSHGAWSAKTNVLANGSYTLSAVAVDAANNVSTASTLAIRIDPSLGTAGGKGNETFNGVAGNQLVDAGAGTDKMVYTGARANFTVTHYGNGFTVTDKTGSGGTDTLFNLERLQFSDTAYALDVSGTGVGGEAYRLYQAAFNRAPDVGGLGFWIHYMDAGMSQVEAAGNFMSSPEFISLYGSNPTNLSFVNKLYDNVLHRPGEQSGIDFWINAMDNLHTSRAQVLAFFAESPENVAALVGVIQDGFAYTPLS